jgi:hypothetical protein
MLQSVTYATFLSTNGDAPKSSTEERSASRYVLLSMKEAAMTVMTIRAGLRRLEFKSGAPSGVAAGKTHVIVEFAQSGRLTRDQAVRIHLGLHNGVERVLEGLPTLVTNQAKDAPREFVYRLEGEVA